MKKEKLIGRVYMIINPKGKVYVGSTTQNFERRWNSYFNLTCKGQIKLYNSLVKYGVENHIFKKIWVGDIKLMFKYEFILGKSFDVLNPDVGLNLFLPKIDDTYKNISEESRINMSNSFKGKKLSEETKKKIGDYRRGKKLSEKSKLKVSIGNLGKIMSEETKLKISNAKKGRKKTKEQAIYGGLQGRKTIYQYKLNGEFIQEWKGAVLASQELNIDSSGIIRCCKKKIKSCGGWLWSYEKLDKLIIKRKRKYKNS